MKKIKNLSEIRDYLDRCITFWRKKRDNENSKIARYYIDAYQSCRISIFGKCKEEDKEKIKKEEKK